ncbi:MAG TPA: ATP-binding protein [Allosphingosinicella sp.]|jgi:two-component system phosphate regulon sensor histidine kinase PhoR
MALRIPQRLLAAGVIVATAIGGALLAGGALWAALIGLIGGAAAVLVGWRAHFFPEPVAPPPPPENGRERWAREIVGAMPGPMLLIEGGRIVVANPAAKELLGQWIEGQDARLAMRHPATVERLSRPSPSEGGLEQVEVVGLGHADRRWLMTIATLADGSRLVHLEDRSEAIAAERMRVDFVANASHELRTPLATILGFIETLQDRDTAEDSEVRERFLALMHGEGKRMQQLIEDLMSLSRIEAERFNPPRAAVDLVQLVEEVRAGCAQLLRERSNELVLENRTDSTIVSGDRAQLLQLIRNLVVNAVKYGRAESPVTVVLEDEGAQMIRIAIADRGEGIAAEHLPRLTERFYRVDAGRSRAVGGTGLGLAIVKHIVSRHRGRLDIRSVVGEGTNVLVSLPRAQEPQPPPLS